jgi:hypothetical protein
MKTVSSGLYFKKFMAPAMTYDQYFLCHELTKLSHVQEILDQEEFGHYILRMNGNSTKLVVIQQLQNIPENFDKDNGAIHRFKIYCISKINHVIMNQIREGGGKVLGKVTLD